MAAAARPDSEPGDSLRGLRVLIVEDEALIAMVYEDLLAEQGCESLGPAASVAQALALIAADPPDAALLDVNLDGEISGPVAERLHQEGIPFLVVTGSRIWAWACRRWRRRRGCASRSCPRP
jgi:CheY-like chemotaxis protein